MTATRQIPAGRAALLVLGMLFLRALVPAGFMLAPVDGHLAVVLCDAQMSAGAMAVGHSHHHPHADHDPASRHHGGHGDPTCPYAQSAGPGALPTLPVLASAVAVGPAAAPAASSQTRLRFGPTRQQSPRGPPPVA